MVLEFGLLSVVRLALPQMDSDSSTVPARLPRDVDDLTGPEQVVWAAIFLSVWALLSSVADAAGLGGAATWIIGAALNLPALPVVGWYARNHEPWLGPSWWQRSRVKRGFDRVGNWYRKRGRPALILAVVLAVASLASLSGALLNRSWTSKLHGHGVKAPAVVADVAYNSRGSLDTITVSFVADGTQRRADLATTDNVTAKITVGQSLTVVYDAEDPTLVLTTHQLDQSHSQEFFIACGAFAVLSAICLVWSRRRWQRDSTEDGSTR